MPRSLGRYRLISELGAGGMGVVHRAHDTALDREVAVKVLPPELAAHPDRRARFEREARAVARLNHPNIMQVYDVGEDDGTAFAVVELIDGDTLRQLLTRRRLAWDEAVAIALQVSQALAAAHAAGIVHRDLKPENVMVDDAGRVKVLDFGLAHLIGSAGAVDEAAETEAAELTRTGMMLGTAGYMSPEQVKGEPCDPRTDVFALGCLLYELLTGRRAFTGATPAETSGAVLRDRPPLPSTIAPEIPPALDRIVERCLAKRQTDRFSTGHDVALALEAVSGTGASRVTTGEHLSAPQRRTWRPARLIAISLAVATGLAAVVVLLLRASLPGATHSVPEEGTQTESALNPTLVVAMPFENQTGHDDLEPLGRMAADWITQGLARFEEMEVVPTLDVLGIARTSDGPLRTRDIAAATEAEVVVTGAYYLVGDALHFQTSVVDAADGELIYTDETVSALDKPMEAIRDLQGMVVGAIATRAGSLDTDSWRAMTPPNAAAYREFVAGLEAFAVDYPQAITHFDRALSLDPDFLAAGLWKASALGNEGQAAAAYETIQDLDAKRDRMTPFERRWVASAKARLEGRYEDAAAQLREQLRHAPRSTTNRYLLGLTLRRINRPREADEVFAGFSRLPPAGSDASHPACAWPFFQWAQAKHMMHRYQEELELASRTLDACGDHQGIGLMRLRALAGLNQTSELEAVLDELMRSPVGLHSGGRLLRVVAAELRAHGHRALGDEMAARAVRWERDNGDDAEDLAWSLRLAGEIEAAQRILQDLLGGQTDEDIDIRLLGLLGVTAARIGDRTEAKAVADRLAGLDRPFVFGRNTYWRAAIAAWLGEPKNATRLLREAFDQGQAYGVWLHRDPDLEPLWSNPGFQHLLEPKG
jgi:tetratricopeptide (TPR) repeat protein